VRRVVVVGDDVVGDDVVGDDVVGDDVVGDDVVGDVVASVGGAAVDSQTGRLSATVTNSPAVFEFVQEQAW